MVTAIYAPLVVPTIIMNGAQFSSVSLYVGDLHTNVIELVV